MLRSKITIRASLHLYSDHRCDLRALVELIALQESSDSDFSSSDEGDMDFLLLELSFKPKILGPRINLDDLTCTQIDGDFVPVLKFLWATCSYFRRQGDVLL